MPEYSHPFYGAAVCHDRGVEVGLRAEGGEPGVKDRVNPSVFLLATSIVA